ncbi:hypothetical protein [Bradyrhizobium phage BDU-MI-1]|nr:hypothetical protein [Bradyrhizobium phage BDU-MI-1]
MGLIDCVEISNDCFEHIHPGNAGHPAPRDKRPLRRPVRWPAISPRTGESVLLRARDQPSRHDQWGSQRIS